MPLIFSSLTHLDYKQADPGNRVRFLMKEPNSRLFMAILDPPPTIQGRNSSGFTAPSRNTSVTWRS